MFEVTDEIGDKFVLDSWDEIKKFFDECCEAVGSDDCMITVKYLSSKE